MRLLVEWNKSSVDQLAGLYFPNFRHIGQWKVKLPQSARFYDDFRVGHSQAFAGKNIAAFHFHSEQYAIGGLSSGLGAGRVGEEYKCEKCNSTKGFQNSSRHGR